MSTETAAVDVVRGMVRVARALAFSLCACLAATAWAAGTPAGTQIPNTAVITYTYNGTPATQFASAVPVVVSRVLNVRATWQDSTAVPVNSPDAGRVLTFAVSNTGNGTDTFVLARNNALPGDQFDPQDAPAGAIWLESGAQPGFQANGPNADIAYVAGANDVVLAPDASRIVYVSSNLPSGISTGSTGRASLQARSSQVPAGSAPGTQVGVQNGIPSIVGPTGAVSAASGTYIVSVIAIGIAKSVVAVVDPAGGQRVMTGAVLTYRLQVSASGTGVASNVVVTDPLPSSLTFVPGSITVDGLARTDAADGDDSSFSAGTVRTVLPSLPAQQSRAIEFKATVN